MRKIVLNILLFAVLIFALPFAALLLPSAKEAAAPNVNIASSTPAEAQSKPIVKAPEDYLLILDEGTGKVLNVPVREYIIGAIAAEMPITWHDEALKAQGVAAISYALALKDKANPDDASLKGAYFKANPSARLGFITEEVEKMLWADKYAANRARLEAIANDIINETLTYDGKAALTCYHSLSSGNTESAENIWGNSVPYLISVPSLDDKEAEGYETKQELSSSQVKEALALNFAGVHLNENPELWFTNIVLTPSQYIKEITVGGAKINGNDLRCALKLRSPSFSIEFKDDIFTFTSHGYGHGVGMSQYGACSMARQGKSHAEILSYYYKGTTLVTK
ncbi:MAG: SpoIID/LytB domain-containing protein [Oscillospiraceae bacterium]